MIVNFKNEINIEVGFFHKALLTPKVNKLLNALAIKGFKRS